MTSSSQLRSTRTVTGSQAETISHVDTSVCPRLSPSDSLQEKQCGLRQQRGNPKIILLNSNHFIAVETHPLHWKHFLTVLSAQNHFEKNWGAHPKSSCLLSVSESLCKDPHYALTFSPSHTLAWQQHQGPRWMKRVICVAGDDIRCCGSVTALFRN